MSQFDVVVVGAGAAGLTAALGLAKAGFRVAVVEAAAYPGAENWSGCVYFAENLADPDILGPEGVEALAWERRLVQRGFFTTDGHGLLGMTYRDPSAFRHCYTVLRPIYDHHLAQAALQRGVAVLSATTAESLIRDKDRVIGVCTQRGPLYADLVFLAEGDASHLVTKEGYERFTDQRETPKFLQGIKQVIDMPPGAIEEIFKVGPEDGVAYEMLLRNGTLRGKPVHLNMGGFLYTNRDSLSVGLVLPADNLAKNFAGDPNLLLEWFENLPALKPWLRDGKRGVFGAKIIRGGGAKDIPHLIDDGLAIGGGATAIGIDFPYPNFTGPASAMGLLLTRAAVRIREEKTGFTRDALQRHYVDPLQKTHYWQDVEFLRRWPGYVKKTQVFFGRNIDLTLGSAYVWTRPGSWFISRWANWLRLLLQVADPTQWPDMRADARHLAKALRLREVFARPELGRLLLDGWVNAMRDLFGKPRANLPEAGTIEVHYSIAGGAEPVAPPLKLLQRWFARIAPVLAPAARTVYANDTTPLTDKLPSVFRLLFRQINMVDVFLAGCVGIATGLSAGLFVGWYRLLDYLKKRSPGRPPGGIYPRYALAASRTTDLTVSLGAAAQQWEPRLAQLAYRSVKESHIQVFWPRALPDKNKVVKEGLWHVCPAHVYEARVTPLGQLQVVVNFENCIKCETCWRTSDLANWARDGQHRFIYPVGSAVLGTLLEAVHASGAARTTEPHVLDPWQTWPMPSLPSAATKYVLTARRLMDRLERKIREFEEALAQEPRTIDKSRSENLEMLARYAQQLALALVDELQEANLTAAGPAGQAVLALAQSLATKAEERARLTWDQRFQWAAADGRQLSRHYLAGLRTLLPVPGAGLGDNAELHGWLAVEDHEHATSELLHTVRTRLDAVFPANAWRDLEQGKVLTSEQDSVLRDLIALIPRLVPDDLTTTLHPPSRKAILAELGRRDPSLAYRAASHLWARDLAIIASGSAAMQKHVERWSAGDEWTCFAAMDAFQSHGDGWQGEALFVPACKAQSLLVLVRDQLVVLPVDHEAVKVEPLASLGFRGAGLARVRLVGKALPDTRVAVDADRIRRIGHILAAADLTSIAFGMADQLCNRAAAHATSRVQFPGLFHDEEARDTIGKFGVVKKMAAEIAARCYVLETLDHTLSPTDFSQSAHVRAGLIKALVSEALGTAPGSISYNAGQIFGGTGFSEDDILAKFYRDASAWRVLGLPNPDIWRTRGRELLRDWKADGQMLSQVADETLLFEEVAQRKALQAELDEVRNLRSRLRSLVGEWKGLERGVGGGDGQSWQGAQAAEIADALAHQDALLLSTKALLLRTHARMEQGLPSQFQTALLRVWLVEAVNTLNRFEDRIRRYADPARERDDRPIVDPSVPGPVVLYQEYLQAQAPYDSGDFLVEAVDLAQPRYYPDMVEADPTLHRNNREFLDLLFGYFGNHPGPKSLGIQVPGPYERYVERRHIPDPEDLDFCRRHGFFAMPIPKELGGRERTKADYYLLTTNAQRYVDVAISLTIQANTSIGTVPVLLCRDKDLPKAIKDMTPFAGDNALHAEITGELNNLSSRFDSLGPKAVEQNYLRINKRLAEAVFSKGPVKVLAHRFLDTWQQAGQAGLTFDLEGMKARLLEARTHWQAACGRAGEYLEELKRRLQASDLFLRWVASGQISAFALTEPSAGSDTARVATRARLHSVPIRKESDGVLSFVPDGSTEPRYLLDAARLDFREDGVYYRWAETGEPARIHFDEYDYETDDPSKTRYYHHGSRRVDFTDIALPRERDRQLWYDYWELTGAKMWITNGRMCGIMALYAKTEEGVTGFIVDRHAEGLLVGKDEDKLGQCGSPTNELSLQSVRVPRENVIGLEGRGQVNALETLNVGRAGLAMSAMAQMEGLIEYSRNVARARHGEIPDWVEWRLQVMEEERFIAEALAFDVVGKFEHPQTKSVRMESAIAKMVATELLHHVIEVAEEIHGLEGQTQLHLVEKRKRDARVLNIYEGTNEVQRFLILKDMTADVAGRWAKKPPLAPKHVSREVLDFENLKGQVRQRVESGLALFKQEIWQNPNLQANCFLLAEAAAWLKAADSTLARLAWLGRRDNMEGSNGEPSDSPPIQVHERLRIGRNALARCFEEIRDRLRRFDVELTHLRRGYYAAEVRAASLLFDSHGDTRARIEPRHRIERTLSVLVIVEPTSAAVPNPRIENGNLVEPHFALTDADRSALETALMLRDAAPEHVRLEAAAVGPRGTAHALREVLSLGFDRVCLVTSEHALCPVDAAARALGTMLRSGMDYDVILCGSAGSGEEEGALGRETAELLNVRHAGSASHIAVQFLADSAGLTLLGDDGQQRVRSLPACVSIANGPALRDFTTRDYLAGLSRSIETHRWPGSHLDRSLQCLNIGDSKAVASSTGDSPRVLNPSEAADRLLLAFGLAAGQSIRASFDGDITDVTRPTPIIDADRAVAVIAAEADGRMALAAAQVVHAAHLVHASPVVVVIAPPREEAQRKALGQLAEWHQGDVVLLTRASAHSSPEVQGQLLAECWSDFAPASRIVIGEAWAEDAFSRLALRDEAGVLVARVRRMERVDRQFVVETTRSRGKLRLRQTLPSAVNGPCWLVLSNEAEIDRPVATDRRMPSVERWSPRLERFYARGEIQQLLDELKQETGLVRLADADYILDVGFGVVNQDGYEEVIVPLENALRSLGVQDLVVGGSRKVTEELHLLPIDRQIGQSGVSVNPRILIAVGISGAPQHLQYIGSRATIIAFNRDPEAPIMTLNQRVAAPRVFPVIGDLFQTVPALTAALLKDRAAERSDRAVRSTSAE